MSTESRKTCDRCKPVQEDRGGLSFVHMVNTGVVELCPPHSGERIAELTRENHELALACEARDDERITAQNRVVDLEREIEILREDSNALRLADRTETP